jgi:hypothetical protein
MARDENNHRIRGRSGQTSRSRKVTMTMESAESQEISMSCSRHGRLRESEGHLITIASYQSMMIDPLSNKDDLSARFSAN